MKEKKEKKKKKKRNFPKEKTPLTFQDKPAISPRVAPITISLGTDVCKTELGNNFSSVLHKKNTHAQRRERRAQNSAKGQKTLQLSH